MFLYLMLTLLISQIDKDSEKFRKQSAAQLERSDRLNITGQPLHFNANDPRELYPYFEAALKNSIDYKIKQYYLDLVVSINTFHLTVINNKHKFNLEVIVFDDAKKRVDGKFLKKMGSLKQTDEVSFFDSKLRFDLQPGDYTVVIIVHDLNSGKKVKNEYNYIHREVMLGGDLLISDFTFRNSKDNREYLNSNLSDHDGDLIISFDVLNLDTTKEFTYDYQSYWESATHSSFKNYLKIYREHRDQLKENGEYFFTKRFEKSNKSLGQEKITFTVPKSLFLLLEKPNDIIIHELVVNQHEERQVEYEQEDNSELVSIDTLRNKNIDFSKTFVSSESIVLVKNLGVVKSRMSNYWKNIPSTKEQMITAIMQINYLRNKRVKIKRGDNFSVLKEKFVEYWKDQYDIKTNRDLYKRIDEFYRIVDYCNQNFSLIEKTDNEVWAKKSIGNGWQTRKARIYVKFGIPDQGYGISMLTSNGVLKQIYPEFPAQVWIYKNPKRVFEFLNFNSQ